MKDFARIAKQGSLVQLETIKGEVFTGTLLPMYFVILDDGTISAEIYLSQHEEHSGESFGTVGIALRDIKNIKPY
jgi:hypothetical protein